MKTKYLAIIIALFQTVAVWGIGISPQNFPDDIFRGFVTSFDINHDNVLSDDEIQNVKVLILHDMNISDLTGIEYFKSLENLICDGNQLTNLDLSKNTELVEVSCENNMLGQLNIPTATKLEALNCSSNQLTSIDVTGCCSLNYLSCHDNQLANIDLSRNTKLAVIVVSRNRLVTLNLSQCTLLKTLHCEENVLQNLIFSEGQTSIAEVYCQRNQIKDEAMTALVESLPQMSQSVVLRLLDFDSSDEGNVLTTTQVAVVKGKNYLVQAYTENDGWKQYNGLNPDDLAINGVHFPDNGFRAFVRKKFDTDGSNALSREEIESVKTIGIYPAQLQPEYRVYNKNLRGIEFFTGLTELYCPNNQLEELDLSKNTALREIQCFQNLLTSIVLPQGTSLKYLDCSDNLLSSIDVSTNTELNSFKCDHNRLASLDVTANSKLNYFHCSHNLLTSLDLTAVTGFDLYLSCDHNQLTSLDLSKNINLIGLDCSNNPLTGLDVSNNSRLHSLSCDSCQLTVLDVSKNKELAGLYCRSNQLATLNLAKNIDLRELDCSHNLISSLDLTDNKVLQYLLIQVNRLKGTEMDALIQSLPSCAPSSTLLVKDLDDETEANEITNDNLSAAKVKGWSVYAMEFGRQKLLAAGAFPVGVNSISSDEHQTLYFTPEGKRLTGKPRQKGIYITKGKTVIIR